MKFAQKLNALREIKLLEVIRLGHPKFEDLHSVSMHVQDLGEKLQTEIENVKLTAATHGYASLSACQIQKVGYRNSFFVMRDQLEHNRWFYGPCKPDEYQVIINPLIQSESELMESQWEECPSLPFQIHKVTRPESVKVIYQDHKFLRKSATLSWFKARVFQHEYQHLLGKLVHQESFKVSPRLKELLDTGLHDEVARELEYFENMQDRHAQGLQFLDFMKKK